MGIDECVKLLGNLMSIVQNDGDFSNTIARSMTTGCFNIHNCVHNMID